MICSQWPCHSQPSSLSVGKHYTISFYSFLLYRCFFLGSWMTFMSNWKKKRGGGNLGRCVNNTAYLGIGDDLSGLPETAPCGLLIAKYTSLGYLLQCRHFGPNLCLWQEEERWQWRSECLGGAYLLIPRWLWSWQELLLVTWLSACPVSGTGCQALPPELKEMAESSV